MEAEKRIKETTDAAYEAKLQAHSFRPPRNGRIGSGASIEAGTVRCLDGHGGGILVESHEKINRLENQSLDFVLDLTGACLSCGAAPGTLDGINRRSILR